MRLTPLVPLDSPELESGPYTDVQFQNGAVSIRDCGLLYGYHFQPERFTGGPDVFGTSHSLPHPQRGRMPLCETPAEAVDYLKRNGYYGRVMRYAMDPKFLRGEGRELHLLGETYKVPPAPWITAGVTDIVKPSNTEPGTVPASPLYEFPAIHHC